MRASENIYKISISFLGEKVKKNAEKIFAARRKKSKKRGKKYLYKFRSCDILIKMQKGERRGRSV